MRIVAPLISRTTLTRSLLAILLVLLQSACSVFGIRSTEEPHYAVVEDQGRYQLRRYAGYVVAETTVDATFDAAGNIAFKRLFGYISGQNQGDKKIDMTAPVMASSDNLPSGSSMEMTAPVTAVKAQTGWRFAFVLPAEYTLDSAPVPFNNDVMLREVKPKLVAVLHYSGSWNEDAFQDSSRKLMSWMAQNQLAAESEPRVAGYDPPWTLPFLRRNEVMVDVRS